MKRFFIFFLCLSLLSLLIIPAFADERISEVNDIVLRDIYTSETYDSLVFYRSVTYSRATTLTSIHVNASGTTTYNGVVVSFSSFVVNSGSSSVLVLISDSNITVIDNHGSLSPLWDGVLVFDSPAQFTTSFVNWYNTFPNGMNGNVSDGVSASIGWIGSVLSNLVASSYVLPLVGLAVALFCVLPFGITTIKNLMKGY